MKTAKNKAFDAVAESRKWREATRRSDADAGGSEQVEEPTCVVRENPPKL